MKLHNDHLRERELFLESIEQGLADAKAGRVVTDVELEERLGELFGTLEPG